MVLEVNWKKIASLNVRHVHISKNIVEVCLFWFYTQMTNLEIVENCCYIGDTIGARQGAFDSAINKITSGRGAFVCQSRFVIGRKSQILFYMCRWPYAIWSNTSNIQPKDKISAEELKTRLKFKSTKKCLQIENCKAWSFGKNWMEVCLI